MSNATKITQLKAKRAKLMAETEQMKGRLAENTDKLKEEYGITGAKQATTKLKDLANRLGELQEAIDQDTELLGQLLDRTL